VRHRRSAFLALPDAGLFTPATRPSIDDIRPLLVKFKCGECGRKETEI
jgi:hypothetical protein